jgi:hypothetical protein
MSRMRVSAEIFFEDVLKRAFVVNVQPEFSFFFQVKFMGVEGVDILLVIKRSNVSGRERVAIAVEKIRDQQRRCRLSDVIDDV